MNPTRYPFFALFHFVVVLSLLAGWPNREANGQTLGGAPMLKTTSGERVATGDAKWNVFCFLGTECPLARLYGPRLQSLADRFEEQGVQFIGVNSNLQDSAREIDAYARQHGIRFPIVHDRDQSVADWLGATRTPEVFVVDSLSLIRYQGRIDDQYSPGIARSEPTRHDLRETLEALLGGERVARVKTNGVGCLITRVAKPTGDMAKNPTATFYRDVLPLLYEHCVECHRRGEIGPMELTQYDEVMGWGDMILEVIDQKRMPPWHADPDVGSFHGERRVPKRDRDRIASWLEQGMPPGNPGERPEPPRYNEGWHFPADPDVEFSMRDRAFSVPADGTVEYQYFVVDPEWKEDKWIKAAQVIPGSPSVVHHCIVFVRPPDGERFDGIGWLGAYVPGQRAIELPAGHARHVPAGSKLVFQMHYTPNGVSASDLTRLGVWLMDPDQVTHRVTTRVAIEHQFEIPPRQLNHQVKMFDRSFPKRGKLLGITPHMHLRGKSFELKAVLEDASTKTLLRVPNYDFNWQHWYQFAHAVDLRNVQSLEMAVSFDNSEDNPVNPAPDEYVMWGDQTWEEMAVAFYDVATEKDSRPIRRRPQQLSQEEIARWEKQTLERAKRFMKEMDKNGDGVIERDETPVTFKRYGFRRIDANGDDVIDLDEARIAAQERS